MRRTLLLLSLVAACGGDPGPGLDLDAAPAPPECGPGGGGPYALIEQETVTVPLACTTDGEVRDGADFAITGLPTGAVYDPATATITWTPGLDQAAVYDLGLTVTGESASGQVRIAVADAFDTPGNVPPLDPTLYPEELGVPVMFVSPAPTTEAYQAVTVVYGGHTYSAEAKLRGATSLGYPKQSYAVKFAAGDHFSDPTHAGGFLDKKRIVLTSTFDDNSYVRQRLAYQLWDDMDAGHVPVQTYSAVVYLDGQFYGLYEVSDHPDVNLFAARGLADTGNVYKAYNHDANFRLDGYSGAPKQTLHDGYLKKDGAPADGLPGAYDDLDALVDFVATAAPATFASEIGTRVDLRDFRDWYVFVTYTLAGDSGGKNCYLYHDPTAGPWRYAPWDFNHSFGQDWQTYRTGSQDFDDFRSMNNLFVRIEDDPALGPVLDARYAELMSGPLSDAAVLGRFDAMVAETAAVARRDWRKWRDLYRSHWGFRSDLLEYDQEVAYTRQWLVERGPFLRGLLGL